MSAMHDQIDETCCPLCGEDNACLNACLSEKLGGDTKNKCWCNTNRLSFPDELIAQVPNHLKHKTCICQTCVEKYLTKESALNPTP